MTDARLQGLPLDVVVTRCRQEASLGRQQDCLHCYELFRRAIEQRDAQAWSAISAQYRPLMASWLNGQPPLERDMMIQEAQARFWRTLSSQSDLSTRFEHIGALLRYLRQCTISCLLDHQRREKREKLLQQRLERHQRTLEALDLSASPPSDASETLLRVQTWLREHVTDPVEQRLLQLSYESDLLPAEIVRRFPEEFPDVQEVRRIKERILRRAKRALEDDPPEI